MEPGSGEKLEEAVTVSVRRLSQCPRFARGRLDAPLCDKKASMNDLIRFSHRVPEIAHPRSHSVRSRGPYKLPGVRLRPIAKGSR